MTSNTILENQAKNRRHIELSDQIETARGASVKFQGAFMQATLISGGQITLPKALRKKLK